MSCTVNISQQNSVLLRISVLCDVYVFHLDTTSGNINQSLRGTSAATYHQFELFTVEVLYSCPFLRVCT